MPAKEKPHILVVDDEQLILESLTNLLEFEYTVHAADNGHAALQIVKREPIKVVMSDQRMPAMFGHELLREVKKLKPNIIRILLTGYSDLESIMNSVNAGEIFRYINKPWKSDMILKVFQLAVQLHDKLSDISRTHQLEQKFGVPESIAIKPASPTRSVHIEVEEKSGSVMFVGYKPTENQALTASLDKKFSVANVSSYDEALQEIAKKPVSVIVSDVQFDGLDFLNTIKQEYPHIVTVVLSEVIDANLAIRSINELNVFKYLTKPVSQGIFEQVISEASEKHKQYQEKPQSNLLLSARTINPQIIQPASPANQESIYRLKLRALQANLAKVKQQNGQ
jgi:response regulator RpfG family c-di-GMP phosphodiesterase